MRFRWRTIVNMGYGVIFLSALLLFLVWPIQCQTTDGNIGTTSGQSEAVPTSKSTGRYGSSPPCTNTSLSASVESVSDFRSLVIDGAIFVHLKLAFADAEFDDPTAAYLEDVGNIINPLRWVWAKGGRGKLLLSSPFDFNQLSLTTLGTGVSSVELKISGCFNSSDADDDKLGAIVQLLHGIVSDEETQTEDGDADEMLVCLERQLGKEDFSLPGVFYFPGSSYTMMQSSSAYDCWSSEPLGDDSGTETLAPTQYWLGWIFAAGVILALFSPMAMSFFIQKNPPFLDSDGKKRLSLVSDLPLGLKYTLCFWRNDPDNFCVASTRWTVFILLFTIIQYIPVLVSFLTDTEGFMVRSSVFYNFGPINVIVSGVSHLLVNLVFFLAAVVLLERFLRPSGQSFLEPLLRERDRSPSVAREGSHGTSQGEERGDAREGAGTEETSTAVDLPDESATNGEELGRQSSQMPMVTSRSNEETAATSVEVEESNIAYRHIVLVEAPRHLWAPSTPMVSSQAFFYYMGWRAKMGLSTKAWKFVLVGWLWDIISQHVGAPPANPRTVLCVVIFAVLYPLYLPFGVIFFGFNCLPLLYCITRCLQTAISNDVKWSELAFAALISLASIAWFFKFVATFVYIAELLGYSFMGFIVNAEAVGPTVLVVVIFAGFVIGAITRFYDGYCVLFKEVMEIAEEIDEKIEKKSTTQGLEPRRGGSVMRGVNTRTPTVTDGGSVLQMTPIVGGGETQGTSSGRGNHGQRPAPTIAPLITTDASNTPSMELNLFWLIVEKYRPIRVNVASTFFELLVIVVAIGFGMSILSIVDSLSELSTTVELFSSVIIAGVVPTVILALRSPASQDCYAEATKRRIKADIMKFAKTGKL